MKYIGPHDDHSRRDAEYLYPGHVLVGGKTFRGHLQAGFNHYAQTEQTRNHPYDESCQCLRHASAILQELLPTWSRIIAFWIEMDDVSHTGTSPRQATALHDRIVSHMGHQLSEMILDLHHYMDVLPISWTHVQQTRAISWRRSTRDTLERVNQAIARRDYASIASVHQRPCVL